MSSTTVTPRPFVFEGRTVRAVQEESGNILFCGSDVAKALGYKDTVNALKQHCRGVVKRHPIQDGLGRTQQARFITEGDLYRMVASSKLPEAQRFESWIFDEVIPQIRRTGGYVPKAESPEETMARAVLIAQRTIKEQERKLAAQEPKVLFADAVTASDSNILVGVMAKILRQNGVPGMGQNRFFKWLRENGYLSGRKGADWNMPTQRSTDMGLFFIKETTVPHKDGHTSVERTTLVTPRGQVYFINKFLGADALEVAA
jgi:anti-repressor protein